MESWSELKDSRFLKCDKYGMCFTLDLYLSYLKEQEPTKPLDLNTIISAIGKEAQLENFGERATAWHRFLVTDSIHAFLDEPKRLESKEWCALVNLCAELMQSAEPANTICEQ